MSRSFRICFIGDSLVAGTGDPEFLASIKELATKIEVADGESKAVDVKLAAQR